MKIKKILAIGLCGAICLSIAGVTYASASASDTPKVSTSETGNTSGADILYQDTDVFSIRIQTVDKSALTVKIGLPRQIMRRTMRHRMCSGGQPMNTRRG